MRSVPSVSLATLLVLLLTSSPSFAIEDADGPARGPNSATAQFVTRLATARGPAAPVPAELTIRLRRARAAAAATGMTTDERHCLATAIYFEARGESQGGQAAVAQVILNRAGSGAYPDTVCGVVYQGMRRRNACQFSFACDGKPDRITEKKAWAVAQKIADEVIQGRRQIADVREATHYHATYVSPYWAPKMRRLTRIGRHVFYQGA